MRRALLLVLNAIARLFHLGGYLIVALVVTVVLGAAVLTCMPGSSYQGPLPPLSPEQADMAERMRGIVEMLARQEHSVFRPEALRDTRLALEHELTRRKLPYVVQPYRTADGAEYQNIQILLPGPVHGQGVLVIGAHYDSFRGSPGADDNASGVAAVLELAAYFKDHPDAHRADLMFMLYSTEEPPYFHTDSMGSKVPARQLMADGVKVRGMLSLETLGCYLDDKGSQTYPPLVGTLYPDRGDFVGFVGDTSSYSFVRQAVGLFRASARFPSEGIAAPRFIPGIDWSDHQGYFEQGIPALMVTDTAPFRYRHYHTHRDSADKVDFTRLARVTYELRAVLSGLAQ